MFVPVYSAREDVEEEEVGYSRFHITREWIEVIALPALWSDRCVRVGRRLIGIRNLSI